MCAEAVTHEDGDDDGDIEEGEGRGVEESLFEALVLSCEDIIDPAEESLLRIIRAEDRRAVEALGTGEGAPLDTGQEKNRIERQCTLGGFRDRCRNQDADKLRYETGDLRDATVLHLKDMCKCK